MNSRGSIWLLAGRKTVDIFPCAASDRSIIYWNAVAGEGRQIVDMLGRMNCPYFSLVAISDLDWNKDMAPWDGPAVFKSDAPTLAVRDLSVQ